MRSADVLVDAFGRIHDLVHDIVDGLTPDQLAFRVDDRANSIGWLIWHLTRIQDDHLADATQTSQAWTADGWADRFGLPFETSATGYGHGTAEIAAVRVGSGELLTGYHHAVHVSTVKYVGGLTDDDLGRIVDTRWDPPVSLGTRLVSVLGDGLQHAGQAAFVRGIVARRPATR